MTTKTTRRAMLAAAPALAVAAAVPVAVIPTDGAAAWTAERINAIAAKIGPLLMTAKERAQMEAELALLGLSGPDESLAALIAERSEVWDRIGTLQDYIPGDGTAGEVENDNWNARLSELDKAIETWPAATWTDVMAKVTHTARWINIPAMVDEERMLRHLVKDILRLRGEAT